MKKIFLSISLFVLYLYGLQPQQVFADTQQTIIKSVSTNGQTFTTVVTPTPSPTSTPTKVDPSATTVIGVGGGPGEVIVMASASPNVVAVASNTQLKELPKTGLPLGALAIVGLVPVGWKLRKYGFSLFDSSNPNSIWQNRELKK